MNRTYVPGKTYYRLPPCPAYDIAKTESWLSDLAEEGLFLAKDGFFAGVATFDGREPAHVKYRLEAVQKIDGFFSNAGLEPDEEQLELSEKYSWEYVAKRKDFFIYRSLDPDARELNTDPEVQALTINAVKKRQREAVCTMAFLLLLYPILITRGCVLLMTLALGTWCASLGFLWGILTLVGEIAAFVYLKKTQKCLQSEGHYRFAPDWKGNARSYLLRNTLKNVIGVVFLLLLFNTAIGNMHESRKENLADYHGTLPFATMEDFAGEGSSDYLQKGGAGGGYSANNVLEKSDWLAPRCIQYSEHAQAKTAEGKIIDGGLYVNYCQLQNSFLAKICFREFYRTDRWKKPFTLLETPELSADEAIAYSTYTHFPTVIIRKGNIVVQAEFYQFGSDRVPLEEWAKIICDSINADI